MVTHKTISVQSEEFWEEVKEAAHEDQIEVSTLINQKLTEWLKRRKQDN